MTRRGKISPHAKDIARNLFEIGAVKLNASHPFTWASGIKSPIYCDNRKINSFVSVRRKVAEAFLELIRSEFPEVEMIAGVATGGIPMGVMVADQMDLPFIYVRQNPKEHGLMRQVEGHFEKGSKVVLIEDLVSTGGSSIKAAKGLREEGLELLGLISIMTYSFNRASELFDAEGVNDFSICDLDAIVEVASTEGKISLAEKEMILGFRENPQGWGKNI